MSANLSGLILQIYFLSCRISNVGRKGDLSPCNYPEAQADRDSISTPGLWQIMPQGLKLFTGINIQCCHAHFMSKSKSHEHLTSKGQRNEISSIYLKGKLENL